LSDGGELKVDDVVDEVVDEDVVGGDVVEVSEVVVEVSEVVVEVSEDVVDEDEAEDVEVGGQGATLQLEQRYATSM